MATIVRLRKLDPVTLIESTGGTVVQSSGVSMLDGPFRLVVAGAASDPLDFSPTGRQAVVEPQGSDWLLVRASRLPFTYTTAARIGTAPWIEFSQASVRQPEASNAMAIVALEDLRASLMRGGTADTSRLMFPTRTGDAAAALVSSPHPENPSLVDFFVLPFEGGHAVALGTLGARINVDHAVAADVVVQDDCTVSFLLPQSGARALIVDGTKSTAGPAVRAETGSGLAMAGSPGADQWKRLRLRVDRLQATDGWLRVSKFSDAEVWLGHVLDMNATAVAKATGILTSTARLGWELSIPPAGSAPPARARLSYRDPTVSLGKPPALDERLYGVRVNGLGSRSGVRPPLATNYAHFDLATSGAGRFDLQAGGTLPSGDGTEKSLLVPSLDPRSRTNLRLLDLPSAGEMALRCAAPAKPTESALLLDTRQGMFTVEKPIVASAPAGITAGSATAIREGSSYARWLLQLPSNLPNRVVFELAEDRLKAAGGDRWLNDFRTADPTAQYGLIEHPGTVMTIDGDAAQPVALKALGEIERTHTEVTTIKNPDGKEIVAYTAFFAALSWLGVECIGHGSLERCIDEKHLKLNFPTLDDAAAEKYVKDRGLQSLRVVYFTEDASTGVPDPGAVQGLHKFVDDNMKVKEDQDPSKFHWPFALGLSMLLFDKNKGYADDIARERDRTKTTIAFDLSGLAPLAPIDLGYTPAEFAALAEESPAVWPRGSSRAVPGARLDPSDKLWRGIFFRDMPLFLPVPPGVATEFEFIGNLLAAINDRLMLDYGWRDESGPSFVGGFLAANDGIKFSLNSWTNVLEMFVQAVTVKGAAGAIVTAQVTCLIRLNRLRRKNSTKPIELKGTFALDLQSGNTPVGRIEITDDGQPIETDSIPGFKAVALRRISTDLRTAQFELLLTATPELANALPFLSTKGGQLAILAFNLKGNPSGTLSLALPQEVETNLFGRWAFTAEAISVSFAGGDDSNVELRVRGRIRLGLEVFGAVGAEVVVRRQNGELTFDVELQSISGSLTVGSLKVEGSLKWADKNNTSGPVRLTNAGTVAKDREMWGVLRVEDPGVIGRNELAIRVGNQGELSYWIATIGLGKTIPLGIGELRNPALLVAHNADFGGKLAKTLSDPTGSVFKALRPPADIPSWLSQWQPSSSIGTLVAGSGYMHVQARVAAAPSDDTELKPELATILLFTDRGLVRVDGVALMLGAVTLRFGLTIDFQKKRIIAGLQAPTIKIPPDSPQYELSAGYITVGLSFAGADPFFRLSIGWPERIGNDEFERDWTKAVKLYIKSMFPINTFWGGYLAELRSDRVVFGFAARAGFTWADSVGGGIVKGSAEFGIAFGGVFQFGLIFGDELRALQPSPLTLRPAALSAHDLTAAGYAAHHETITAAIEIAEAALNAMASADLAMSAEIFGDIWGKASVEFLGVTLVAISVRAYARFRVCGSLHRGITQAKARVGFEVSVTILCVTFHAEASVDITLLNGDCPLLLADGRALMPGEPLALEPPFAPV